MIRKKSIYISFLLAVLVLMCLAFSTCSGKDAGTSDTGTATVAEQETDPPAAVPEDSEEQTADTVADADQAKASDQTESAEKTGEEQKKGEQAKKKEKKSSKTSGSSKSGSGSSNSSSGKTSDSNAKKEKVWVEPVYETRTITPDTGTMYCNGKNSKGGCGASWHGTKNETYDKWYDHWQDYAYKQKQKDPDYQCDHIHDDYKWVPDEPYTETVLIKDGYWKDAD